jgi:cytochrome c-type biogenesis protein
LVAVHRAVSGRHLLVALLADRMMPVLTKMKQNMRVIEIVSGVLLIGIGVLMLLGGIAQLSQYFSSFGNDLETRLLGSGDGNAPTLIVAFLAGFLSFASPCVLPLVPAYLGYIGGWAINNSKDAA